MAPTIPSFASVSSEDLLIEIPRLASNERHATAALVAALAAMDERRLHVREGYSSLFAYCTGRLHLSEPAACRRIDAARACRAYPVILERLAEGTLTLAAVSMLAKHLTGKNHLAVLDAARHRSKRDLEELVARLAPRPDVPSSIRRLPIPKRACSEAAERGAPGGVPVRRPENTCPEAGGGRPGVVPAGPVPLPGPVNRGPSADPPLGAGGSLFDARGGGAAPIASTHDGASAAKPAVIRPLAPTRYQVTVTVSADTHTKLIRAQDLLRHAIPSGDPALVLDRALTVLLAQLERTKFAASAPARTGSPAAVAKPSVPPPAKRRRCAKWAPSADQGTVAARDAARATGAAANTGSAPAGGSGVTGTGTEHRASPSPAARSRRIPAAVRREVWARSQGQCEFVSETGHRCEARGLLEFHHRVPFSVGGLSTVTNVVVHCRAHNGREAEVFFGTAYINARWSSTAPGSGNVNRVGEVHSPSLATVNTCRDSAVTTPAKRPARASQQEGESS